MFYGHPLWDYLKYALIAALCYGIIAAIFIYMGRFDESWILYIGNFLFGLVIAFYIYAQTIEQKTKLPTRTAFTALAVSVLGAFIACTACLLGMAVSKPAAFEPGIFHNVKLKGSPVQMNGKNNGFVSGLILNALLGNVSFGFFFSILLPFTLLTDQKGYTNDKETR